MLRCLILSLLTVLFMGFTAHTAKATDNNFTSNTFDGNGQSSIKLDVDGTTSVEWTVQKQVGGQWVTVQTGTNGTTGDPYTISLNNPMTEAVHRVIGTTSGASGPYKATATPL